MATGPRKVKRNNYNTNLASEFYVLASLYRQGFDANLTLGNKKAVDIVVIRAAGEVVTLDVKAVAARGDWLVGRPPIKPKSNHFIVLLSFEGKISSVDTSPRIWILPHADFLARVGVPKTKSDLRFISRKRVLAECEEFESAWHLLAGAD